MTVVQYHLQSQGPPALLWNSTVSFFCCLLLPPSWTSPRPVRIRILTSHTPAFLLTWSWTDLMSHFHQQLNTQSPGICLRSLSTSCVVSHSFSWQASSVYPIKSFFKIHTHSQYLVQDVSWYTNLFSCTPLWSKPSLFLWKLFVHTSLDPL